MIFHFTPTTCSLASHIALEESGGDFEPRLAKLWDAEALAQYKTVNPYGKVPALETDGGLLTESIAILYYVARSFPQAGLLPGDALGQAQALSLASWFSSSAHIARRQWRAPQRFTADETAHPALKAAGWDAAWANLQRIDALLEGRDWLCGERLSIADGYGLLFYDWAVRDEMDAASLPNFTRFKDRMTERPGVRRALERERSVLIAAPANP